MLLIMSLETTMLIPKTNCILYHFAWSCRSLERETEGTSKTTSKFVYTILLIAGLKQQYHLYSFP